MRDESNEGRSPKAEINEPSNPGGQMYVGERECDSLKHLQNCSAMSPAQCRQGSHESTETDQRHAGCGKVYLYCRGLHLLVAVRVERGE